MPRPTHLYNSRFRAEQEQLIDTDGEATVEWVPAGNTTGEKELLASFKARADLNFVRPGKDAPPAISAGSAPDRFGLLFFDPGLPLRAGMRIVAIPNDAGKTPVEGIFDVKVMPDAAIDYSDVNHMEAQIVEQRQTSTRLTGWPTSSGDYPEGS